MRLRFSLATLLLLGLASLTVLAQNRDQDRDRDQDRGQQRQWGHPRPPRAGACFYKEAGFEGDYFCLRAGERWPSMPPGFNDRISSIRVMGGAVVQLFEDSNFGGRRLRIDDDVDSLVRFRLPGDPGKSWNDRVSAIAVFNPRDDWDRQHPN
jgi:hypothetical protein